MADDDKEPAPPPRPQQPQPPVWVPDQVWDTPPLRRNNVLYDTQPNFVPPPMEPPPPPADARDDEINARFQVVLRSHAELTSAIDRLRGAIKASPAAREIGRDHNQGPPLQIEELDAEDKRLLALLQDKGPRPAPVDDRRSADSITSKMQCASGQHDHLPRLPRAGSRQSGGGRPPATRHRCRATPRCPGRMGPAVRSARTESAIISKKAKRRFYPQEFEFLSRRPLICRSKSSRRERNFLLQRPKAKN
jgi:hypothetical protein